MRVLNIAPRRSGKTTICLKHFLESYKKDPIGTWLIVASPYQGNIKYFCDKLSFVNNAFGLGIGDIGHPLDNIVYSTKLVKTPLRNVDIKNLFIDDYSWSYYNGRFDETVCYRSKNIEMWSDQFLTLNEFKMLVNKNENTGSCNSYGDVISSRFINSCIYRLNFRVVSHTPANWCDLIEPFWHCGTMLGH